MAGLEVVVRPVVFPSIRPPPARALAPEDNPDQGIATLGGSGGRLIDLPHSFSVSFSQQRQKETKRLVDVERIYQVDEEGNINRENFVDVERAKASRFERDIGESKDPTDLGPVDPSDSGDADAIKYTYINPPQPENVETLETDKVIRPE